MVKTAIEFNHTFSFTAEWRQKFVEELGGQIDTDPRIMTFNSPIAEGETFFMELAPGLAVLLIDTVIKTPLHLIRTPSEEDFWIIYYDLSDDLNRHTVNKINYQIGDSSKFGLGVIDSRILSTYNTDQGNHMYSLRIFIDKNLMKTFLHKSNLKDEFKEVFNRKKKKIFFYKHIDSRSKVTLFNLKQQHIKSVHFEFEIKSAVYNLLAYFFERINAEVPAKMIYEKDADAVVKTQEFLLSQLHFPFPGIDQLAEMANMSTSKYGRAYRIIYHSSPALFFKDQKLKLAHDLLASGKYKYIADVALDLGYSKTTYFTMLFKNHYGYLPSEIFIRCKD